MARIRTIKPEFWSDEKLSECSVSARLLFIGLISFADDEGRMEYSPARIRMQVFPCGTVKPNSLSELIGELSERSLIRLYLVDGHKFLDIPNFLKHQKINRPTESKLPAWREGSLNPHGALNERSPLEGKGREGKGVCESPLPGNPSVKAKRKTPKSPLPEDFDLDPELEQYAADRLPEVDTRSLLESFRGKATAKGWMYVNWRQAFQEFIRNASPNSGHWSTGQYPKKSKTVVNWR